MDLEQGLPDEAEREPARYTCVVCARPFDRVGRGRFVTCSKTCSKKRRRETTNRRRQNPAYKAKQAIYRNTWNERHPDFQQIALVLQGDRWGDRSVS